MSSKKASKTIDHKKSHFPPYVTTIEGVKTTLEHYGIAIVPGVLDLTERKAMIDGMWAHFSRMLPGLKRDDPSTWREVFTLPQARYALSELPGWSVSGCL